GPAHPDVSPDGTKVVFQAGQDGSWDIWIANIDGTDARVFVDCVAPCITLDAPAFSPDGTTVAFSRLDQVGDDDLPSSIEIADVATAQTRPVLSTPSGVYVTDPRWSPDGRSLVVTDEDHRSADGSLQEHPLLSRVARIDLEASPPVLVPLTPPSVFAGYPD